MKKLSLVVLLLMATGFCFAQGNITFADVNVKALCVANWDTNGDGELSYAEAAAVTDLGQVFRGNTTITSFEELQYFTGLTAIGNSAFSGCSGLASVTIPNLVTLLGDDAFSFCSGLISIEILSSVISIGYEAFYDCNGLTSVYYTGDINQWCGFNFSHSYSNPLYYAHNLFINNQLVTDLFIPESVTSIGNFAFCGYSGLTTVTISNSVTSIGSSAFLGCSGLTGNLIIPNSVTSIGGAAFSGCSGLTGNLIIPNSVTSIGKSAFYECSGLTSVIISNSLTSINEDAFSFCTGLTSIEIPNSVTSIGRSAFYGCSGLIGNLIIPNTVTSIDDYAFSYCSGLNSLAIGNSVATIGDCAFSDCSALDQIIVDTNNIAYDSRENCNAIIKTNTNALVTGCKNTMIPNSVTSISRNAFSNCSDLTSITIPNSVTTIGYHAFINCSGLTLIKCMAGAPPTLGESAFYHVPTDIPVYVICNSLESYQSASGWSQFTNIVGIETEEEFWESACDSYSWHGTDYTNSGTYTYETTTPEGCQRIETLHLIINLSETEEYTVTAEDSYIWHGETYTESGTYTYETTTAQDCQHIETLYLTITHGQQFFIISASVGPFGHISPEGEVQVEPGGLITFTITPDEGCAISKIIIDGTEYASVGSVTFSNVDSNHTIEALFWGVGIEENEMPVVKICPNPAKSEAMVECEGMRRITLYNLSGVRVFDRETYNDAEQIALDGLSSGVYVVEVVVEGNYCQYVKLIVSE